MKTTSNKQFICFKKNSQAEYRIICFPPAGSGASFYSKWHRCFPDNIEIWACQLPGREYLSHQHVSPSFHSLIDEVTHEIVEIFDKKTILYGHSFGAALAFFVASSMEASHHTIDRLVVSARKPISAHYQH